MNPSLTDPSIWFTCPRPGPDAAARVFFFPYAGGGPAVFGRWCIELPHSLEGRAVHYPGRGSRYNESPITDLSILVELLSQAILPLLDKPFAFFGHSLGGLAAFELARQLRRKQLPQPEILFVSACGAPDMPDLHPQIHSLPDAEFVNELKKINGIPREILRIPEALELSLRALRADFELIESYRYQMDAPLDCPIVAFGGLDDPRLSRERIEKWAGQTASKFESQFLAGDHFFINQQTELTMISFLRKYKFSTSLV